MDKQWLRRNIPNEEQVEELMQAIGVNSILATLMAQRNLVGFDEAKKYFNPHFSQLHNPMLMRDMNRAVERINAAVAAHEKIMFYGDYDVDGTTSVALIYLYFKELYTHTCYYLPDRQNEGYGVSMQSIDFAASQNVGLIIAMDCGIKATEQVAYARSKGIDFIICDHHTPGEKLPEAVAVLDPKRSDCEYPYKELSGCGITFKLLCALSTESENLRGNPFSFIDLVAVSIASDIVPLTGENRVLAHFGLNKLNTEPIAGLERLKQIAGYVKPYDITDVVFKIGPRINAAGRLKHASMAVELLIGNEVGDLTEIGKEIDQLNNTRKELEQTTVETCIYEVGNDTQHQGRCTTVVFGQDWHKGVIGIVASKLVETYYRPTVVLTQSGNGLATGSARSVEGFDLYEALHECAQYFSKFGGHKAAAGLTMPIENIAAFKEKFDAVVASKIEEDTLVPKLWYDTELSLSHINWNLYRNIERMGPFGPHNMKPTFVSRNVRLEHARIIGQKHLKFSVKTAGSQLECIAFNFGYVFDLLKNASTTDICYTIEVNEWQGNSFLQLNIKDLKVYNDEA
ncbi:single-stranded-DNA-specific exonuclease RecJ [bacterium]|nr:single-stranded-DNA-specific exonuclease RecJ [bacterium]